MGVFVKRLHTFRLKKIFLVITLAFFSAKVQGQFSVMPYDERYDDYVLQTIDSQYLHLSFKPAVFNTTDLKPFPTNIAYQSGNKTVKRLLANDFYTIKTPDINIHLNLLGWLNQGHLDSDSINYSRNTRGFEIYGTLGKKLFYYTKFLENQTYFIPYILQYTEQQLVVPGEGWWKPFGDSARGRDYTYAMGYLVWKPYDWLSLRLGNGKNFIGSGYRSLLLSDNSFVYPYFGFTVEKGRWQFTSLWTQMYRFRVRYYFYHYSKHTTLNLLSYAGKNFELSLFQAVVWQTSDYQTYVNRFPALFFMPVAAAPVYGLDAKHNVLLGLDANIHYKTFVLYGQLIVDKLTLSEPLSSPGNRYGWQAGIRTYDLFMREIPWLQLKALAEINYVAPYTYQSQYWNQNYAHYNQPLAHPLGAGFTEKVLMGELRVANFVISYKLTGAWTLDCITQPCMQNIGTDIFNTAPPADTAQTGELRINHNTVTLSLILHPKSGLRIYWGFDRRLLSGTQNSDQTYVYFGIRSTIGNLYYDF